jgi:hypothetical protein
MYIFAVVVSPGDTSTVNVGYPFAEETVTRYLPGVRFSIRYFPL